MIGAGVSGLAAALELVRAGRDVLVVEARDRVGGRTLSLPVPETASPAGQDARPEDAVDLGATWFWANEPRIRALAEDLGIECFPQHESGDHLAELDGPPQRFRQPLSGVASYRFAGGAQRIASRLRDRLPAGALELGVEVHRVGRDQGGLAVETSAGRLAARRVILAVPPALAVARIAFDPPLPEPAVRIARATPVWMASTTKTVVVYREPFWRDQGFSGTVMSYRGPLQEIHDASGPSGRPAALFGFSASGRNAEDGAVVEQLVRLFGPGAADPAAVLRVDWGREEHTAPAAVTSSEAYELFGHPALCGVFYGGRLAWASTETSVEAPGHLEGALAAAERAVAALTLRSSGPGGASPGGDRGRQRANSALFGGIT